MTVVKIMHGVFGVENCNLQKIYKKIYHELKHDFQNECSKTLIKVMEINRWQLEIGQCFPTNLLFMKYLKILIENQAINFNNTVTTRLTTDFFFRY